MMELKFNQEKKQDGLTFEEGFEKFLLFCKLKNLRDKTIKDYKENYNRFLLYLFEQTTVSKIMELNQSHVDGYVIYLYDTKMKTTSINTYLRGLRAILNFYVDNEYCYPVHIHMLKVDKVAKETYTDIELFRLLVKPDVRVCDFAEYRNWAIINFFVGTGVRASTLIHIRIKDLDLEFDRIFLGYTKNRQSYVIPLSNKLKIVMKEYLNYRKGKEDDFLFCNQYGTQLSLDGLKHAISKYNRRRGVVKTSLHLFRHTFAKKAVMNGMNVFVLQKWLGHSDITVTKEYINLYADDLAQNMQKLNPLDTFGTSIQKNTISKPKRVKITL